MGAGPWAHKQCTAGMGQPTCSTTTGEGGSSRPRQMVSRLPNSLSLTDKGRLYDNIAAYCEKREIPLTFLPITFHLDRSTPAHSLSGSIGEFVELFEYIADNTSLTNMWMIKPTKMNQGRDIHLFSSLERLRQLVMGMGTSTHSLKDGLLDFVRKENSVVLQKYIESPLLIGGHKFDIRVWALVDHEGVLYYYPEGYLRFSSLPYTLGSSHQDQLVHLTNHSLQKHGSKYQESFNIQPLAVLEEHTNSRTYQRFITRIKEIITITFRATIGSHPPKLAKNVPQQRNF